MSNNLSIIAGGSTGMGKATAAELVREGRTVLIIGRGEARLTAAKAALDALGAGTVETFAADLSNQESVNGLVSHIENEPRHIDQLVNAADHFFPSRSSTMRAPTTISTWTSIARRSSLLRRWRKTWPGMAGDRLSISALCGRNRLSRPRRPRPIPWRKPVCTP